MSAAAGWEARVLELDSFFALHKVRILLARHLGASMELVLQDGSFYTQREDDPREPELEVPPGWIVPLDALEAIRDALDERLGRRYDEALVFELRQALERERTRNDELVEKLADAALYRPSELLERALDREEVRP